MAYGARDHRWIARAGWASIALGIGFMFATALAIWLFPRLFVSAYIDVNDPANAEVVVLSIRFLALAAMFQLFDGAQAVAAGALRGLQDTRMPMLIAGFGYWVAGFGASIWLGFGTGWQGVGIWTGLLVGLFVVSALLIWRWTRRDRLGLLPVAGSCIAA
jgi:MATE family multidrug resistance protein